LATSARCPRSERGSSAQIRINCSLDRPIIIGDVAQTIISKDNDESEKNTAKIGRRRPPVWVQIPFPSVIAGTVHSAGGRTRPQGLCTTKPRLNPPKSFGAPTRSTPRTTAAATSAPLLCAPYLPPLRSACPFTGGVAHVFWPAGWPKKEPWDKDHGGGPWRAHRPAGR